MCPNQTDVHTNINSAVAIYSYPQEVTFLERQDIDGFDKENEMD